MGSFLSRVSITPHTMRSVTFIFACLALLFALCLADEVATQQQQQQQQQPPAGQQKVLAGSPDADTSYIFSDVVVEEGFYPGAVSHVVLGFKNTGQRPFGFSAIGGSLYYSMDAGYVLENYTAIKYEATIHPGEEYSFTYPFRLHPMLNEGEYGLRFTAIYRDEFNTFATTFFNETVSVLEPHRDLHITDILQFGLIVAVIILAIYGAFDLSVEVRNKNSPTKLLKNILLKIGSRELLLNNTLIRKNNNNNKILRIISF